MYISLCIYCISYTMSYINLFTSLLLYRCQIIMVIDYGMVVCIFLVYIIINKIIDYLDQFLFMHIILKLHKYS